MGSFSCELIGRFTEVHGDPCNCEQSEHAEVLLAGQKDCTGSPKTHLYFKTSACFAFEANLTFFPPKSNMIWKAEGPF